MRKTILSLALLPIIALGFLMPKGLSQTEIPDKNVLARGQEDDELRRLRLARLKEIDSALQNILDVYGQDDLRRESHEVTNLSYQKLSLTLDLTELSPSARVAMLNQMLDYAKKLETNYQENVSGRHGNRYLPQFRAFRLAVEIELHKGKKLAK